MKLLGVNAVDHPGGAEIGFLRLADRLRARGWEVTLTSPDEGGLSDAGYPWLKLDVGGLGHTGRVSVVDELSFGVDVLGTPHVQIQP